ncbi:glutathione S-transferase [Rhodobacteraceae bacterium D3-12]|nr:glutathione S-transferase [Rhodobacteraceae bacterium D3-12]
MSGYTVHYLDNSRAHRVLWLLEELGLDYAVKTYPRGKNMRAPAALKALHPLGKSPIVETPFGVLAESGAILEELCLRHPDSGLAPADPLGDDARAYRYWMHAAEGSVMPLLVNKLIFSMIPKNVPWIMRPIGKGISNGLMKTVTDPGLSDQLSLWAATLSETAYFAGDHFTAADIQMSYPVDAMLSRMPPNPVPEALTRWHSAVQSRPAYQRALERGGRYDFAS